MTIPRFTRNQWIAIGVLLIVGVLASLKFTDWWEGHA